MEKDFESLAHTADIKLRVFGSTLKELFRNALVGMFQTIEPRVQGCEEKNGRITCDQLPDQNSIEVSASAQDLLLVDFLSEALYLSDVHNQVYLDAQIHELSETFVRATVFGVPVQGFGIEIKAVTYHELEIKKVDGLWQAIIVFDI